MVNADTFDCFLSHNSKDKPAVRALAAALRAAGVSVWLDEEQLRPGLPWQPLLESGIRASRSVAVLIGADGLGPWEGEEMRAALTLAVRENCPVIPVLLADARSCPDLPLFLANRTWVDLRPGSHPDAHAGLDRLIWGITGKRIGPNAAPSKERDSQSNAGFPDVHQRGESLDRLKDSTSPATGSRAACTALQTWCEKLAYLLKQEAITADAAQKFALAKQIEEARAKIAELEPECDPPLRAEPIRPLHEEPIRLDVARPKQCFVDEAFTLGVAVRHPDSPPLKIGDLPVTDSSHGKTYRLQAEDVIRYRIEVTGANCEVSPVDYAILLRRGQNAEPRFFRVTPHLKGMQDLIVNAYQEDDVITAQTRIIMKVRVRVQDRCRVTCRILTTAVIIALLILIYFFVLNNDCSRADQQSLCVQITTGKQYTKNESWKAASDAFVTAADLARKCGLPLNADVAAALQDYQIAATPNVDQPVVHYRNAARRFENYFNGVKNLPRGCSDEW